MNAKHKWMEVIEKEKFSRSFISISLSHLFERFVVDAAAAAVVSPLVISPPNR